MEAAIDHAAELVEVSDPHMLQHSDRDKDVKAARYVPVVVFDEFHAAFKPFFPRPLTRVEDLVVRDVESLDRNAVMPGHMQGQSAPAASRLDDHFSGLEPRLSAHVVHFGNLGLLETVRGRREIRAGVYELAIQPQLVKVSAKVVMVMNVLPRTTRRVGLPPLAPAFPHSRI